jgi:DNA repair exonuclease SbcCD ATPase subunit
MKIDRIMVDGFGKLCNQQIRFAQDRVNLLVEDNEFGKSTIAEAICAALYGFSRERTTQDKLSGIDAKRPLSGGVYKVTLELSIQGHPFRVTRDFDGDTVLIVDLESRQDVTGEFFPKKGGPQVGERLIGLSREQFERSCFVGHHSLIHQSASTDLKRNFEQIASSSRESKTAAQAIDALQKGLQPLRGAIMGDSIKADTEVHRLESELARLRARLSKLEDNRRRHDSDVDQLSLLEEAIDLKRKERARLEGFQAAAYAQELGVHVSEQEQLHLRIEGLRQERDGLVSLAAFPAAINDNLVSWLTQLNVKAAELSRRETEIASTKEEVGKLISQRDARFSSLAAFTPSDRDELVAVREQLLSVTSQTAEIERLRQAELESLRNRGILPARFEDLHSKLKELESPIREAAVGYPQQHQQLIAELTRNEGLVKDKSHLIAEIDTERKSKKRNAAYLLAASVISMVIFGILCFLTDFRLVCGAISAISFAFVLLLLVIRQRAIVFRSDDRAKATLDVEQSTPAAEGSRSSLQKLESEWNSVAKSVGMESANELARACLEYFRLGETLREFRRLTNELNLLEQQKQRVQSESFPYLQRAGRSLAVSSDITQQDVREICRELEAYFRMGDQIKTFDDRLNGQTVEKQRTSEDLDALAHRLRSGFQEASIKVKDSAFDKAYDLFRERLEKHQRLKRINTEELPRLEKTQIPAEQFSVLKRERESAHEKLLELGAMELVPQQTHGQYTDELSKLYSELESLTEEQAQTRRTISEALGDYDRESNDLLERVDELDAHLGRVISYRDAVSLALEKLKSIANDVHREWSESLNGICDDMLSTITSVYKSIRFADDLSFTVETGEPAELLTMRDITSRLSLGAREQLFLLQRLAVSRFLSDAAVKLPVILDDPLVTSDDDRFLRLMRFVIEALPEEHQGLIFSCHKRRQEWVREELGDLFAERVHLVQLEPIETGGVSLASEVISHVNEGI